jgi:hypothetical protein
VFSDRVIVAVLIFGFPIGVLVGYMWLRISRARRALDIWPSETGRHEMHEAQSTWAMLLIGLAGIGVMTFGSVSRSIEA